VYVWASIAAGDLERAEARLDDAERSPGATSRERRAGDRALSAAAQWPSPSNCEASSLPRTSCNSDHPLGTALCDVADR
jgi:hypothetical protein